MNSTEHHLEFLCWRAAPGLVQEPAAGRRSPLIGGYTERKKTGLCADSGDLFPTISYGWMNQLDYRDVHRAGLDCR
ncbi:unnamed protein product [Danaus chrysippus]|uniref:(African queen) hypothetical protein n=1 Tax=Danaus chrysippus TaxID=151541 RepID=A0A8J2R6P1_9NEOP|nr:unnamed protein product [Danaus chrysippus]